MNPTTRLARIAGQWTRVENPVDNLTVFPADQVPFKCPECGAKGSMVLADDDNPRICEGCYQAALYEIEEQDGEESNRDPGESRRSFIANKDERVQERTGRDSVNPPGVSERGSPSTKEAKHECGPLGSLFCDHPSHVKAGGKT